MRGKARLVRVTELDRIYAGTRFSALLGPVAHGGAGRIEQVIASVQCDGPAMRLGLQPDNRSRRWRYEPDAPRATLIEISETSVDHLISALPAQIADLPRDPLVVLVAGEYVLMSMDHGLGDATLGLEMLAAIAAGDKVDLPQPTLPRPFLAAFIGAAKSARLRDVFSRPQGCWGEKTEIWQAPEGVSHALPAIAHAKSTNNSVDGLRRAQKSGRFGRTGKSFILTRALHRSFNEAGIPTGGAVSVLIDMRRYLPRTSRTLANLSVVVSFGVHRTMSAGDFSRAFVREISSMRPYIRMVAFFAKTRLQFLRRRVTSRASTGRAHLVVSDISGVPAARKLRVSRPDDATVVVMNEISSPDNISVAVVPIDGELQFTATFNPLAFDRRLVQKALELVAADPIGQAEGKNPE